MRDVIRPYQAAAVDSLRVHVRGGRRKCVLVAPCGAGKTRMGCVVAGGAVLRGRRVVWIAHRRELAEQASAALKAAVFPSVIVVTVQALLARGEAPEADLVIWDEVHHGVSETWSTVLQAYQSAIIIGLTATPERADGRGLAPSFEALVVAAQISQLVEQGYLVPCEVVRPRRALRAGQIAQTPAEAYAAHAQGSRCIVFAPHVKAATEFATQFPDGSARIVHAGSSDRAETMARYRAGAVSVLVNVGIATEGVDVPETETVIVARGCGSVGLWIQMAGRAMRPSPGKSRALIIDLRGVSYELGRPDADREYSLEGQGISGGSATIAKTRLCVVCQSILDDGAERCLICGTACGLEMPKVVGEPLVAWNEVYRGDGVEVRVARLAKFLRAMLAQGRTGRSLYSAQYKYAAVYGGEKPPREVWDAAMTEATRYCLNAKRCARGSAGCYELLLRSGLPVLLHRALS